LADDFFRSTANGQRPTTNGKRGLKMSDKAEKTHGTHSFVHPLPMKVLVSVFIALLILTVATTEVASLNLGSLSIYVALAIAVIKGALVILFFMHLKYDNPFYGIVLILALFFVSLLIGSTMMDSTEYAHNLAPPSTIVTRQ
jgi:cytochrome c oxidase subunit 4